MTSDTYKALLFYGPKDVRVEDVPFKPLHPGEIRVRIAAATTCGTDRKTFDRGHPILIKSVPSAIGHEMAGTVSEISDGVTTWQIGDRVVVANSAPCFSCFFCRKGKPNLCENLTFLNGGFSQYLTVPESITKHNVHLLPPQLSFEAAALTEPLACVIHASEHMGIAAGERVAIYGTGPMAFLFIAVVKKLGAEAIIVGRNPERLRLALDYGAAAIVNTRTTDAVSGVRAATQGYGADVAIEATGQPEVWEQTVGLVRKGGRVCLYGGCPRGTEFKLDTFRVHYEEITVSGIFHHTPDMIRRAVTWLAEGRIRTDVFLKELRGLADLANVLSGRDAADALKVVIHP